MARRLGASFSEILANSSSFGQQLPRLIYPRGRLHVGEVAGVAAGGLGQGEPFSNTSPSV